jgi:hypothetical protein
VILPGGTDKAFGHGTRRRHRTSRAAVVVGGGVGEQRTPVTSLPGSRRPPFGLRGDGAPQDKSGFGNIYADEGNHWDVLYYNCGGS